MNVVDLFAGAGGFGLGFVARGHRLLASVEMDRWACDTLRRNSPRGHVVIEADITKLPTAILSDVRGEVDVLIGGPPCQGFSVAGPQHKDPADPRNSLFREFVRFLEFLQPRMTVMENVPGLLRRRTSDGRHVIDVICDSFREAGYHTYTALLKAHEFGVPQIRERLFIFGFRNAVLAERAWATPQPTHGDPEIFSNRAPVVTLWDAIGNLPAPALTDGPIPYKSNVANVYEQEMRVGSNGVANHVAMKHTARLVERFKLIGWGESQSDVDVELLRPRKRYAHSTGQTYDQNNRRLHPDRPSHTLPASFYANFLHPYEHRNFTAREGARIQSFPDRYIFEGLRTTPSHSLLRRENRLDEIGLCQYNQIGNAVPPLLAGIIATHLETWPQRTMERAG